MDLNPKKNGEFWLLHKTFKGFQFYELYNNQTCVGNISQAAILNAPVCIRKNDEILYRIFNDEKSLAEEGCPRILDATGKMIGKLMWSNEFVGTIYLDEELPVTVKKDDEGYKFFQDDEEIIFIKNEKKNKYVLSSALAGTDNVIDVQAILVMDMQRIEYVMLLIASVLFFSQFNATGNKKQPSKSRCYSCMKEFDYGYDICPYCGYDMTKNQEEKWFLPTGTLLANRYTIGVAQSYGGYYINYHGWDQEDTQKVLIREYFPNEGVKRIQGQNELTVYPETFYPQFSKGLDDFLDELKIIKKLPHHEEIFNLKSCFEENFTAYQVMEELEGSTIEDMVKEKGKISIEQSLKLTKTIGAHILKFHSMGVVYGELNPQNIFLCEDGRVKLLPVKSYDYIMSHKIGSQNDVVSTILFPAYTPLELFYDKCMLGPWSDVYALGAVLYYMLTGIEPADAVERFNNETLVSLSRCGINVSEKINRAVQKALSVEPDERYQSMEHFLRELT